MRSLYLVIVISIGILCVSCSTSNQPQKNIKTASTATSQKNPLNVSLYKNTPAINHKYKVIGEETVSKFNKAGIKRQIAHIHDAMRKKAASMGGDAVINITHDNDKVTGTVIAYEDNVMTQAIHG